MSAVLADTHAVLWYLFEPAKLSGAATAAIQSALAAGDLVYVSAVTLIEVRYLVEKYRIPMHYLANLLDAVDAVPQSIGVLPVSLAVARATERVPRSLVSDLADRIIAATALAHGLPLVTADARIRLAPVATIW